MIEVDRVVGGGLAYGPVTETDVRRARWYLDDLLAAAHRAEQHAGDRAPGSLVRVTDLYAEWWGDRLMGVTRAPHPVVQVEVAAADGVSLRSLPGLPAEGAAFSVTGRLRHLRGAERRASLLRHLGPAFTLQDGRLVGPGASVGDPFAPLGGVLTASRSRRLVARVHGDLNPRNVLAVTAQPYLIDFAFTRTGEPLLADFARLEGLLARTCLPEDLDWAQHVRVARLLSLVSALGEPAIAPFARRLGEARADLGRAFSVLAASRLAARRAYPVSHLADFARDHHEQTLLFSHLALKWAPDAERRGADVLATAALAGAAAEALDGRGHFGLWPREALLAEGAAVAEALGTVEPGMALPLAAALAVRIDALAPHPGAEEPLAQHMETARRRIVAGTFQALARKAEAEREDEHRAFIRLTAFIELQAALHAAEKKRPHATTFREALLDDELLARSEHLRDEGPAGEDILTILAREPRLVLLGDAGAGKTSVARHWEHQLARAVLGGAAGEAPIYAPILRTAHAVAEKLGAWRPKDPATLAAPLGLDPDHLALGTVHLTIDALNEIPDAERTRVAEWIAAVAHACPRVRILVCHRLYSYIPGLLPFPVSTLQKVDQQKARGYVFDYLSACRVERHAVRAERLAHLLFDDPERKQLRDLAQTPLFLWMIVEHFRQTDEAPSGRGALFRTFVRWYLTENWHARTQEATPNQAEVEEREALLGRIGFALVEQGKTAVAMEEVRTLVGPPQERVLDAVIRSEMVGREGDELRFLHQSFQEYFAARHFLETEAHDTVRLKERVHRLSWQDTFVLLLGFAGEFPEVSRQVIEIALGVDPVLTARCLRMSEDRDPALLGRFVAEQEATLRDPRAGAHAWEVAARALAEHGRGPTRRALLTITADPAAPVAARCEALKRLAAMPEQARFEPVAEKVRVELTALTEPLLEGVTPEAMRIAAIESVARSRLTELSGYVGEQIHERSWPVRRAARRAYETLGIRLIPGQQRAWVEAARERLSTLEAELHQEAVLSRISSLNDERVEILGILAEADGSDALPQLLERRFLPEIGDHVGRLVDGTLKRSARAPQQDAAKVALEVLVRPVNDVPPIAEWLKMLRTEPDVVATAAVHRLSEYAESIDDTELGDLLSLSLSWIRLGAVAHLVRKSKNKSLVAPLEGLLIGLIERVTGVSQMETFLSLWQALRAIDLGRGSQAGTLAKWVFYERRLNESQPGRYPWVIASFRSPDEDITTMLEASGDKASAAVFQLSADGGGTIWTATFNPFPTELSGGARARFTKDARAATTPVAFFRYARAAVQLQATELLPWMTSLLARQDVRESMVTIWDPTYGLCIESHLANVLRATGHLAGLAIKHHHAIDPNPTVEALTHLYATLPADEDRSIVVGLTTALGFLGRWQPLLEHLGTGEPWMHQAALNIFNYWIPEPPEGTDERKRAQGWINNQLQRRDLAPEVRTTLLQIREALAESLGSY